MRIYILFRTMETVLLIIVWIIIWFFCFKWFSRWRKRRLKKKLQKYKHNLKTVANLTEDYNERLDAVSKIQQCDEAIKKLEDQWY